MTKKELIKTMSKFSKKRRNDLLFESYKNSQDPDILILVLKYFGQLKNINYQSFFKKIIEKNNFSLVRREAVSSLGRLKLENNIDYFISLCVKDKDPNVILQSIRALSVFKKNKKIQKVFVKLLNHPNELIRDIVQSEVNNNPIIINSFNYSEKLVLLEGDSSQKLKKINDNCIDLTFTSPPYYNARDYSIYKSYQEYLKFLELVFKQVLRITKSGRYLVVNTSPIIVPRFSRNHSSVRYPIPFDLNSILVKMGWEFIDDIIWEKPEPSVMNRNGTFSQMKKPLTYKPNLVTEYVFVYRKKSPLLTEDVIKYVSKDNQLKSVLNEKIETTNIWKIPPTSDRVHSAPFPQKLSDLIIKLYSYTNDIVLDPFAGIGTVGKSCIDLNRQCLLIEKDSLYVKEIIKRLPRFTKK